MSILVDEDTRVVVQGITGSAGSFHAKQCLEYGTQVVAGVTPGQGRADVRGQGADLRHRRAGGEGDRRATPRSSSCRRRSRPTRSSRRSTPGCALVVSITEGIPVLDMVKVKRVLQSGATTRLIGPNCPGIITPGAKCKIGIMPGHIHRPGHIGVVSRSGTLTYEAVCQLTNLGLGQSTCGRASAATRCTAPTSSTCSSCSTTTPRPTR